jgi:hypothetical protein
MSYDARSVAMAGVSAGIPNGLYGIFSNPATLAYTKDIETYFGYYSLFNGVWGGPLAVAKNFGKYGVFGISVFGFTSGEIDVVDENNVSLGTTARQTFLTGGLSWAYKIRDNLYSGISIRGAYDKIDEYSANGAFMDGGIFYRKKDDRFTAGLLFKNLGFVFKSYGDSYTIPFEVEAGLSFVPRNLPVMRLALDVNKKTGDYVNFEPGIELNVYQKALFLRAGYSVSQKDISYLLDILNGDQNDDYVKSNWATFCVGAGVKTMINNSNLKIDFGLQFHTIVITPSTVISALVEF